MGFDRHTQGLFDDLVERVDSFFALPDEWSSTMAELSANQVLINAAVGKLNIALGNIEVEVEALKNQPGAEALDFTELDATVARLEADTTVDEDAPVEPPVEPPVDPELPVDPEDPPVEEPV